MNVDPVKTSDFRKRGAHHASRSVPLSGSAPKAEIAKTQNAPVPLLIPEHEVKVQLDTPEDEIVVYQV
jgi:hypothetical protein